MQSPYFLFVLGGLLTLGAAGSFALEPSVDAERARTGLAQGKGQFTFTSWDGPDLTVWTYVPQETGPDKPIVFVMHGTKRDGDRYRDEWVALADAGEFVVIAPSFPREHFPGARSYNLGNVVDRNGDPNPPTAWAYSAIEPIFDEVRHRLGSKRERYAIYGHSAGSQFVHRFLYFLPGARVSNAVAANAGWYTMPTFEFDYPYGLDETPATHEFLRRALSKTLTVLLGTEDSDPQAEYLRKTPEAEAQGPHRLARGQNFYRAGLAQAEALEVPFGWRLEFAPSIGHSNAQMAEFAALLLAGGDRAPAADEEARLDILFRGDTSHGEDCLDLAAKQVASCE